MKKLFQYEVIAPSNIAFVKYWGKKADQEPINPSLSMTLKNCFTKTKVEFTIDSEPEIILYLDDKREEKFETRVEKYILKLAKTYPILGKVKLEIRTHNSFPHSSGIASSASAFCALAGGLAKFLEDNDIEHEGISSIARLGSGSASRSVEGPFCLWGETETVNNSSQKNAIKLSYPNFDLLSDVVVLVDKSEKKVSSSLGHELMNKHPYKETRIQNAHSHIKGCLDAFEQNDFSKLGEVIEAEALELHALMMTSQPSVWLMKPKTLELMEWAKNLRKNGLEVYFTLDAGANVHLISKLKDQKRLCQKLETDFSDLDYIADEQGIGVEFIHE